MVWYWLLTSVLLVNVSFADVAAPLKFVTNSLSDYKYLKPSPGTRGDEIFRRLCTKTPPGCEKSHAQGGIPIACAITPRYAQIRPYFVINWSRNPSSTDRQKDVVSVKQIKMIGKSVKANYVPLKEKGKIITWKWNEEIKEKLKNYLIRIEGGDRKRAKWRMDGFEYRMTNNLKHEEYHVKKHFIPHFAGIEKIYNSLDQRSWAKRTWYVRKDKNPPQRELLNQLATNVEDRISNLKALLDEEVNAFHKQQQSYSNFAIECSCRGYLESCKKMDTFWTY